MVFKRRSNSLPFCSIPAGKSLSTTIPAFSHIVCVITSYHAPTTNHTLVVGTRSFLPWFFVSRLLALVCRVRSISTDIPSLKSVGISPFARLNTGRVAPTLRLNWNLFVKSSDVLYTPMPAHIIGFPFSSAATPKLGTIFLLMYFPTSSLIFCSLRVPSGK